MSTEVNIAKKLIHDRIESQIKTAQARLETLQAQAQAAKANAELELIAGLLTKKRAIDQTLAELKSSAETTYQQTKSEVESRVTELEQSVKGIEVRFRSMAAAR